LIYSNFDFKVRKNYKKLKENVKENKGKHKEKGNNIKKIKNKRIYVP